jgi:hypothetical protein
MPRTLETCWQARKAASAPRKKAAKRLKQIRTGTHPGMRKALTTSGSALFYLDLR